MSYNNRYNDYPESSQIIEAGQIVQCCLYSVMIYGIPKLIVFENGEFIDFNKFTPETIERFRDGIEIKGNIKTVELGAGFCIGSKI